MKEIAHEIENGLKHIHSAFFSDLPKILLTMDIYPEMHELSDEIRDYERN